MTIERYSKQAEFTERFWRELQEQGKTETTHIPGDASFDDRLKVYSPRAIIAAEDLPGGSEFVSQFRSYPTSIIRIGHIGLFATFLTRNDDQFLTTLQETRNGNYYVERITDAPITLGRLEVAKALGITVTDDTIDPHHMTIRSFGTQTVIQDLGTKKGTYLVQKKRPSKDESMHVPDWLPEGQLTSV
jgi:hypothetical protein